MQRKGVLLACLLVCADCFAQQYPFVYYTPKDGLINSRVRAITQDRQGRMYFLTYGGLSVYDGKRFVNYNRRQGLADELVNDVFEAGPDSFLLATNSSKLNTLVRGQVGVFKTADTFCPIVNRFFKSSDGLLYAAADEGLFRLDGNRFVKLPMKDKTGVEVGCCLDKIIEWKNYFILVTWNQEIKEKLIIYDLATGKVSDIELKTQAISATTDHQGQIWVTTNTGLQWLDTVALNTGKIKWLPLPEQFRKAAGNKRVLLLFDNNKKSWFYSDGIISIFSPSRRQVINPEQVLRSISISDLFVDREGILWLATDGNGIMKLRNTNLELLNKIEGQPVSSQVVAQQNDTVWFYNSQNNSLYRHFANQYTRIPLPDQQANIHNIFLHKKQIWLGNSEKLERVENKDDPDSYRHAKTVFKKNKDVRFGSGLINNDGTLIQFALEKNKDHLLYVFQNDSIVMKLPVHHAADHMCLDKKGRLWLTTRNNFIYAFTLHPGQPSKYLQLLKGYPVKVPGLSPRAITVDTNYNVWVGTRSNGIYRYKITDGGLTLEAEYTTQQGLTDNFVHHLSCDSNNTIWVGTQTGLDRIYRKNDQYIIGNISKSNNYFQSVTRTVTTKDNTVWGLTNEAILKMDATALPAATTPAPPLIITSLEVNNRPFHDSSKNFSFEDNNLTFNVAAPSFIDERSIQYSYLLEGSVHPSWSNPSNNATFNFINLSPGYYTLKVRADFPELIYPSQTLSYAFFINPPWWRTWWFLLGIVLLVLVALMLLTRIYYRRKLEKQKNVLERKQAIEKERTRIATDMHDELGAGLSRIKFLSETIGLKKQRQEPVEEDIDKIRMYSHEMIDKMGEIVWALNEKNDSLSDLLAYTRVYAMQYLSENGIECIVDVPTQFPTAFISGEFRRNIYLTVKEALHNIVKHARASQVHIQMKTGAALSISISDNGNGFDENNIRPYGNGLGNMKKRIESIDGTLQIKNGNGTLVAFSVPLN